MQTHNEPMEQTLHSIHALHYEVVAEVLILFLLEKTEEAEEETLEHEGQRMYLELELPDNEITDESTLMLLQHMEVVEGVEHEQLVQTEPPQQVV